MLKYILVSGIALSVLYVLSEVCANVLSNMLKTRRELGIPIKTQILNLIKKKDKDN